MVFPLGLVPPDCEVVFPLVLVPPDCAVVFPLVLVPPDPDAVFAFARGIDFVLACSSDFTFEADFLTSCLLTVLALPGIFAVDFEADVVPAVFPDLDTGVSFALLPDPDADVSFVLDLDVEDDVDFFPAPDPEVGVVLEVVFGLLVFFRCALMLDVVSVTDPADHSVFYLFRLMGCATNPDDCSARNPPRKLLFQ